jgi:hypothetical protein
LDIKVKKVEVHMTTNELLRKVKKLPVVHESWARKSKLTSVAYLKVKYFQSWTQADQKGLTRPEAHT